MLQFGTENAKSMPWSSHGGSECEFSVQPTHLGCSALLLDLASAQHKGSGAEHYDHSGRVLGSSVTHVFALLLLIQNRAASHAHLFRSRPTIFRGRPCFSQPLGGESHTPSHLLADSVSAQSFEDASFSTEHHDNFTLRLW